MDGSRLAILLVFAFSAALGHADERPAARRSAIERDWMLQDYLGVELPQKLELERIACWIDLLVPYCGDYTESNAWSAEERSFYARFAKKRERQQEIERDSIRALVER